MASSLEELIAAQTASANAQKAVAEQTQKENQAALTTEQADVAPAYDKLISDTNAAYQTNLGNARTSASTAGIYRSGIRYNQELALGQAAARQTSEYGAERTRKLADISRRRTLLASQAKVNADKIHADLQSTIADLRYKDYQTKQAQEFQANQAALDRAASAASSASTYSAPNVEDEISTMAGKLKSASSSDLDAYAKSLGYSGGTFARDAVYKDMVNTYGPKYESKVRNLVYNKYFAGNWR